MDRVVRIFALLCLFALNACTGGAGSSSHNGDAPDPGNPPAGTNKAPFANTDLVTIDSDETTVINVLANDADPDGDAIWLLSVSANRGTATVDNNGTPAAPSDDTVVFIPPPGFTGQATLTYTIGDGNDGRGSGSVIVTVDSASNNNPPVTASDKADTVMDSPVTINVLGNDTDPDGDSVSLQSVASPAHGTAVIDDNGTPADASDDRIIYTPLTGYAGPDTLLYYISDGTETTAGSIEITVAGVAGDRISGIVMKGAVAGAEVRLFIADANWAPIGAPVAQTLTGDDGTWSVPLESNPDPLIVIAYGGAFRNEANVSSLEVIELDNTEVLEGLLDANQTYATVTAISSALLERARFYAPYYGKADSLSEARTALTAAFGFDVLSEAPYDPFVSPGTDALRGYYTLALGGVAESLTSVADRFGKVIYDYPMIQSLISDLTDCTLDGRSVSGPVTVIIDGNVQTFPTDLNLELEILRFRNNNFERFGDVALSNIDTSACNIADIVPPTFTSTPVNTTIDATGPAGAPASNPAVVAFLNSATASDNDPAGALVTSDAPATFPLGATVVTFTANDPGGNTATTSATLTIADLSPPALVAPTGITVSQSGALTPVAVGNALVGDNVSTIANIVVGNNAPADGFPPGSTIIVWTATDEAGNSATDTQTITVTPVNSPPVLITPLPDDTATDGVAYSIDVSTFFSDPDGDALSFSATGLPTSLTLTSAGLLSGTPGNADLMASPYSVTVKADDGLTGMVSDTFILTITDVNDAPVLLAPIGDQSATEGLPFTLDLSANFSDADGDTLTFTATGLPSSMTLSAAGVLSGTPTGADTASGPFSISVTASDPDALSATDVFMLSVGSVNTQPTITAIADPAPIQEDGSFAPISFTVGDAETPAGSLTLSVVSSDAVLIPASNIMTGGSGANRSVSLTPAANASGSAVITVEVSDGTLTVNETFSVVVNAVNDEPAFTASGDISVNEDFAGTQTVTVTSDPVPADESGQTVSYSLSPASVPWAAVSMDPATGQVDVTAIADNTGTQVFTITADDGQTANNLATDTFILTVNAVNDAPDFSVSGDITVSEDFTSTQSIAVTPGPVPADEIGQTVTYTLVPSTVPWANVSINSATGQVDVTSVANASGSQVFTITADDGEASNNLATETFTITVTGDNDAPTFSLSGDKNVAEDFTGTQTVTVTPGPVPPDEAAQTVSYSLSPSSVPWANIVIDAATGQVNITSVPDQSGTQEFTITADDGQASNNTATATFELKVNPINDAPVFSTSGDVSVNEDFTGTQTVSIIPGPVPADETSQTVTYALSPSSVPWAGVLFNASTGQVDITAIADQAGTQVFTITADDSQTENNTYSETFTLTVNTVNDAPSFSAGADIVVAEDFIGTQSVTVTPDAVPADEASQPVTYSLSPASVPWASVSINSTTGQVDVTAVTDQNGTQIFTITANDSQAANNTASDTFTLTVNAVNDAPAFTASADVTVDEDFIGTQSVTVTPGPVAADETAQVVTYSLSPTSVPWASVTFDANTGQVDIGAVADQSGTQVFTLTADDGQSSNSSATDTFTLTVNAVNDAPSFAVSGDLNLPVDFSTTETVTVTPDAVPTDETAQTVTYSMSPASVAWANVSINTGTGEVSVTSVASGTGSQLFTITANDGQVANNIATDTFTLSVGNTPPTFTASADVSVVEDFSGTQIVTVAPDPVPPGESGQIVTYSLSPASVPWATVSISPTTGQVDITAAANQFGTQEFTIIADDGQASNNIATDTFTLTVTAENDSPSFVAGDFILNEDFAGTATSTITPDPVPSDEAGQTVTYSILPDPATITWATLTFDSATGRVSATAVADMSGSQSFTVTADDGQSVNNTASDTFTLTVTAVNDAPVFTVSGDINVDEDFLTTETVTVTPGPVPADESGQMVTYSLSPASVSWVNIGIDSSTGEVTITSIPDRGGNQVFTITANDGGTANNLATDTFTLSMNPINDAPTFSTTGDLNLNEDFGGTQSINVNPDPVYFDDAAQTVTYSLSPSAASVTWANVTFNTNTGRIRVTAVANKFGSETFTITADDGQSVDNTASQMATVTVNSVNDAPTFAVSGDLVLPVDFAATETVIVTPDPVPNDESAQVVSYSLNPVGASFATVGFDPVTGNVTVDSLPSATGCQIFTITADDGEPSNNIATKEFSLMVRGGAANEDLNGDGVPDSIQLEAGSTPCMVATTVVTVNSGQRNSTILPTVSAGASSSDPTFVLYEPNPTLTVSNNNELDLSLLPGSCRDIVFFGSIDSGGNLVLDAGAPTTTFEVSSGRAAFIDGCSNIRIYNIGFTGANGKGIELKAGSAVMDNVRIWNNRSNGGLWLDDSDLVLRNSVISDNRTDAQGGGVYIKSAGIVEIENTIISGNSATREGGGLYLENAGASTRFFNNLIVANRAGISGGGVHLKDASGSLLSTSTIAYNEAPSGAGVFRDAGSPAIMDNIVYFNRTDGGAISTYNGSISASHSSYNLIEQTAVGLNDIDITGTGPDWEDGYYLNQATSLGMNNGSTTAAMLGLDSWYTDSSGGTTDVGNLDRGYHYPAPVTTATTYREVEGTVNQITVANGDNNVDLLIEPVDGSSNKVGSGHRVIATLEGANAGLAQLDARADVDALSDGRSVVLTDLGNGQYWARIDAVGNVGADTTITLRLVIDGTPMTPVFAIDRTQF